MKNYLYVDVPNNRLGGIFTCGDEALPEAPPGHAYWMDLGDAPLPGECYYLKDGEVRTREVCPGEFFFFWDAEGESWAENTQLKRANADALARAKRDSLFASRAWVLERSLDTGTPMPDEEKAWRQDLRDITLQPGYPFDITWPVPPA